MSRYTAAVEGPAIVRMKSLPRSSLINARITRLLTITSSQDAALHGILSFSPSWPAELKQEW